MTDLNCDIYQVCTRPKFWFAGRVIIIRMTVIAATLVLMVAVLGQVSINSELATDNVIVDHKQIANVSSAQIPDNHEHC
ncbi:MAG: hypothetical protein SVY53_09490 [Chloroflexota bacterium]|nr:hypothetical protein [Chloroflexota bacterium]